LNVHGFNNVRQTEIHTAKSLVPESSASKVDFGIEKLKSYKSPGIDHIPAEMIKAGSRMIRCEIHILIISVLNKEDLPEEWKESIIVPIYKRAIKEFIAITVAYHFCQLLTQFYPTSCSQG
jgi:predicted peroxiredoxin